MKKIIICVAATVLLLACIHTVSRGEAVPIPLDSAQTMASAKRLLTRLDEINTMDRQILNHAEFKKIRKELRVIKSDLKELDGGTYIPVGSLVLILLVPVVVFNLIQ